MQDIARLDDMAAAFVNVALRNKISVPDDLSITGFDDTPIAVKIWPELTTIRQPIKEMAQLAVDAILKKRSGGVMPAKVVLPVSLMKRGTTKEK